VQRDHQNPKIVVRVMRSEVAAPMHTARAVLFSFLLFLFGLSFFLASDLPQAAELRDVREPLLRSREKACDPA
jgi:hypothetical protein